MDNYPKVLADWNFRGIHFQAWNREERLWVVQEKGPINDYLGPEWSVVAILA